MKSLFILNLKKLLKNKEIVFWALLFPIILSTIFHIVFDGIRNRDNFETLKVNYVSTNFTAVDKAFLVEEMLTNKAEYIKNEGTDKAQTVKIFALSEKTKAEAEKEFKKDKTIYFYKEDGAFKIKASSQNISTAILQTFIDDYQNFIKVTTLLVAESNGTLSFQDAMNKHVASYAYTYDFDSGDKKIDYVNNYHYTVLAMAIIYGAFLATEQAKIFQPNSFAFAKRVTVSGASRAKLLVSALLSSLVVQTAIIALYIAILVFIFKVTFANIGLALLAALIGVILVNINGFFIGIVFNKLSQNAVIAIIILAGTIGGFLSGMMISSMKFFVGTKMPLLSYININALISDSFVSLDFGNMTRYWNNMLAMTVIGVILFGVTLIKFNRESNK